MTVAWKTKTLDDACHFSNGLWKGEKPPFVTVGVIRNTNFTKEGTLDDTDVAYIEVEAKKLEKRRLAFGDIILEKSGGGPKQPVGRVALFDKEDSEYSFSNFTAALRVRDPKELDFRYLHKFLHWKYMSGVTADMQSHSTGIRNLDTDAYKAINISYPSFVEQQRIVGVLEKALDELSTATANTEGSLQNAREIFSSHRESIFARRGKGWLESPLEDLCDIKHGFAFKSTFFRTEGEYVVLTPGNFFESGGYRDRGDKQKYYGGEILEDYVLAKGDLLVAMTEQAAGLLGSPIIVPESNRFLHNQRLGLVQPKPDAPWVNEFFFHVFNTRRVRQEIHDSASGVKVRHTSPTKIRQVVVAFPSSMNEQATIAESLSALEVETQQLVDSYERKLQAFERLKRSLFNEAFNHKV
ncbi:type I restriction enzyme S subunit [Bradyrhizobium sp. USDA 3311]